MESDLLAHLEHYLFEDFADFVDDDFEDFADFVDDDFEDLLFDDFKDFADSLFDDFKDFADFTDNDFEDFEDLLDDDLRLFSDFSCRSPDSLAETPSKGRAANPRRTKTAMKIKDFERMLLSLVILNR